jgi:hypothetical protein
MQSADGCPCHKQAAPIRAAQSTEMKVQSSRQRGAVAMTALLLLVFLLGFMGIALDLGKAFTVQSELQTAMDSCALAATQELDAASDAITRAKSAGMTAANANRVHLQSDTWGGQAKVTAAEITFLKTDYTVTTTAADARYARCEHTLGGIKPWLLGALGMFTGNSALANDLSVHALAVAKRGSTQTACPVPLALKPALVPQVCKVVGVTPDKYGFCVGNWMTLLYESGKTSTLPPGQIGWANLDGTTSASETVAEMNGHCGTKVGDKLGTPGVQATVDDNWNWRFGIYKDKTPTYTDPKVLPDFTGYSYSAKNWPSQSDAFGSFQAKRLAFASCGDTSSDIKDCENITGLKLNGKGLAAPGQVDGGHRQYGRSRRIVLVPVVDDSMKVVDYGCVLLLQPLGSGAKQDVPLEYRGLASLPGSPCTTSGIPGGTTGPLVPVLVE